MTILYIVYIQSLKHSSFPFFCTLTLRSKSVYLCSPLRAVCAHCSQNAHRVFRKRTTCTHHSFSVHLSFIAAKANKLKDNSRGTPKILLILPSRNLHIFTYFTYSLCIHHSVCARHLPAVYLSLVLTKFVQHALIVCSAYAHRSFTVPVRKKIISGTVSDTK